MSFCSIFFPVLIPNMACFFTYSGVLTRFLTINHFSTFFNRDFSVKQKSETLWKWVIFRKDKKFHNFLPFRPDISPFDSSWYLKNQRLTTRPSRYTFTMLVLNTVEAIVWKDIDVGVFNGWIVELLRSNYDYYLLSWIFMIATLYLFCKNFLLFVCLSNLHSWDAKWPNFTEKLMVN